MALRYSDKEFTAFQLAVFTCELAVLYGCLCLASLFFSDDASFDFLRQPTSILIFGLTYYLAATLNGIVLHRRNVRFERILARILRLILVHRVLLFVCFSVSGSLHLVSLKFALCYLFLALCGATLWRQFLRIILQVFRKRNIRKVILLCTGTLAEEVYNRLIRNENNSYQLMGCFDDRPRENMVMDPDTFFLGKTDAVIPYLQEHKDIFEIFCALPSGEDRKALRIMNYAENHLIRFSLIPDFKRFLHQRVDMQFIDRIPIVFLRHEPLKQPINLLLKRLFDIVFSLLFLLTLFIPIFIIVIASFTTIVDLLMQAYLPSLSEAMGVFIPLIVVNCIIMGRVESFASKHGPLEAACDALGMGFGYLWVLCGISLVRELLGSGVFFGLQVIPEDSVITFFARAPGGFFVFGMFIAVTKAIKNVRANRALAQKAKKTVAQNNGEAAK